MEQPKDPHQSADPTYDLIFQDTELQNALANVGVFISDYVNGRNFGSNIWAETGMSEQTMGLSFQWTDAIHPEDRQRIHTVAAKVMSGKEPLYHEQFRLRSAKGGYRWIVTRGRAVGKQPNGKPVLFVGSDTDISELKKTQESLEQYINELETMREVAAVISSSLNVQETVARVLEQTRRIIPYTTATVQLLEEGFLKVIGGFGFEDLQSVLEMRFPYPVQGSLSTRAIQALTPVMTGNVERDFPQFQPPKGGPRIHSWLGIPLFRRGQVIGLVTADNPNPDAYSHRHVQLAATIADHISIALENARLHDTTYQMAMFDSLTGAGSRHRFQIEGRLLYETAFRSRHPLSVLMMDLDHFKKVNDSFGHDAGDALLKRCAQDWAKELRTTDLLARYGGEEFVILLPETSMASALVLGERLRERTAQIIHPEIRTSITVSIGVASRIPNTGSNLDSLVLEADTALYESKRAGRNRVTHLEI